MKNATLQDLTPDLADVVIVGAGAAGLATAIFTRRETTRPYVVLLEGARHPGAKILVSGGSRCNVTNATVTERDFATSGSHATIRRILRALPVDDTVRWFAGMGVALHEEPLGKLFPDANTSRVVLAALLAEVERRGAVLSASTRVVDIAPRSDRFMVETTRGRIDAGAVVLATGGRALPKSGSDGWGHTMAARLGHTIVDVTPALAPLVLAGTPGATPLHTRLSGIAHPVDLTLWVDGTVAMRVGGSLLWTHFGVSGPAPLDISRHFERARIGSADVRLTMCVFPGLTFDAIDAHLTTLGRARSSLTARGALAESLPAAVAEALVTAMHLDPSARLSQLPRHDRRRLAHALAAWPLPVVGTRGFTFAETTAGGVALDEIDPATMASRVRPGLYLVGEVLDVDGRLGGFNFQWAWASARVAARGLARRG